MPDLTPGMSPTCDMPGLFPEKLNWELRLQMPDITLNARGIVNVF